MTRLRTAVIGAGKVGEIHAEALRGLPESELVGVCSRPSEKRDAFAQRHGVPAFDELEAMVRRAGVQAVTICTPHLAHAGAAIAAARLGVHVLVEKPLATTVADCDAMIAAAAQAGVTLGVISQRRLYPPCVRIRAAIDRGALGRPILGTALMNGWRDENYYRSDPWRGSWAGEGGGVLVNQAPHPIDLLAWYLGEPTEVFGFWANLNHPYIEVDDTAVAVVRFAGGALANLVVSNSQNPALGGRVVIHGSNGTSAGVETESGAMFIAGMTGVVAPPFNDVWTVPGPADLAAWRAEDAALFQAVDPTRHFHRLQIQEFLQAAAAGRPSAVSGEAGRRTVQIIEGIYRSNQTRSPVRYLTP